MSKIHCPMIQGGLNINLKNRTTQLAYNQCCLSTSNLNSIQNSQIPWNGDFFTQIRQKNLREEWLDECWQCKRQEQQGAKSFRQAMIEKFGSDQNISGPLRIDLLFDRNCNLACTICGPHSSTMWTKHLVDNGVPVNIANDVDTTATILKALNSLDLSNLGMMQFCGGETLLGNNYWKAAQEIARLVPDSKKIELGFQTNGTQTISDKWFDLISQFGLVKLMISLDGTHDKFEYSRWPASWNQVTDNLYSLKEKLPSNVMFFVQETASCLNLFYNGEVKSWVDKNFNANREGDPVAHSTQLAMHPYLNVENITQLYYDAIQHTNLGHLIGQPWTENPQNIKRLLTELEKLDNWRNLNWKKTFPKVAEFYKDYLM
jgi:hypothetical protein